MCCSSVIVCSRERPDQDQAGPVHPGGACLTRGALDTGTYPASSAALLRLRIVDCEKPPEGHILSRNQCEPEKLGVLDVICLTFQ